MYSTLSKIKVLIVDDHPTVSFGTSFILEALKQVEVVGIANTGALAIEMVEELNPDIVLLDLILPDMEGVSVAKKIKEHSLQTHIIIFTGMEYIPILKKLIKIGISGVLTKEATPKQIIRMVEAVLDGETVIPLSLYYNIDFQKTKNTADFKDISLNQKEEYIMNMVGRGYTNKRIAKELFMTSRSVEYYLTNIYQKLEVNSRVEAIEKFSRMQVI